MTDNRKTALIQTKVSPQTEDRLNKICDDYEAAKIRIDTIAAPKNAKRLKLNTPCVHTGKCSDCNSPDRICKIETIIHKNPGQTNIHVYLIDEELGY